MKISLDHFASEVPKTQPHLLEPHHAQKALNCSFNSGSLLATRDGLEVGTMANAPIRGLYTEDGISFYSWPIETLAFKSPVIDDPYHRVYLLQPSTGVFNVTTTLQMAGNGPTPTQVWKVGVPAPVSAPVLTLLNRTTLPDYPNTSLSVEAWWESSSKAYGKVTPALTTGTVWQTYWFQPPSKPSDAPDGSVLKAKLTIRDLNANKDLATVTMTAGSAARTSAFPGGFEATLEDSGDITIVWGVTATRAYTYVYENEWQEESTNAPPATVSPTYIQDVKVGVNVVSFTGYRPGSKVNIYRTYGTGTTYLKTKVTWIPGGDAANPFAIDSSTQPDSIGTALESADWRPPVTGLQGMTLMPGGWFAAFKDNMLYMTEPYRPHAWAYSQSFAKNIRGICPAQGGLVVACADGAYLLNGSAPISATPMTLNLPQPGIAQRSMVSLDGAVAYASNDGLPMVGGASGTMAASQSLFDREKWRERYSSVLADASLRLSYFDGMIVGSSNNVA